MFPKAWRIRIDPDKSISFIAVHRLKKSFSFPIKDRTPMWTLVWGLEVNRILNTWNREVCPTIDEALQSAASKLNGGFVAFAILSPEDVVHLDEKSIKETLSGGSRS